MYQDRSTPKNTAQVAVVSYDAVFALDIESELTIAGFAPLVIERVCPEGLDAAGLRACAAVVLDIKSVDDAARSILDWLDTHQVPVIVVSTGNPDAFVDMPAVAACFSKPLAVERILPAVSQACASLKARSGPWTAPGSSLPSNLFWSSKLSDWSGDPTVACS